MRLITPLRRQLYIHCFSLPLYSIKDAINEIDTWDSVEIVCSPSNHRPPLSIQIICACSNLFLAFDDMGPFKICFSAKYKLNLSRLMPVPSFDFECPYIPQSWCDHNMIQSCKLVACVGNALCTIHQNNRTIIGNGMLPLWIGVVC